MVSRKKRIFFFGTPDIAVSSLEALASLSDVEIVGVGCFPDKPVGRKRVLTPCPVKECAKRIDVSVYEISMMSDLRTIFQTVSFDLGIIVSFGILFPENVLDVPSYGLINVHFSLLPKYRGASPIQSAILQGEKFSGITIHKVVKNLDAGDILWQEEYPIDGKKASEIFLDFSHDGGKLLAHFLPLYFEDQIIPKLQDKHQATFCRKLLKSDGEIFPNIETADVIYRKFLAFDVFPGVFLQTRIGSLKLIDLERTSSFREVDTLFCAQNSTLRIIRAQISGKKEMSMIEMRRGHFDIFF